MLTNSQRLDVTLMLESAIRDLHGLASGRINRTPAGTAILLRDIAKGLQQALDDLRS